MIDENLRPWLIEVNASPSMSSDSQTDADLKAALLDDTFTTLDAEEMFEEDAAEGGRVRPGVRRRALTRTAEWGVCPAAPERTTATGSRRWRGCGGGARRGRRGGARGGAELVVATGMPR